jgi:hypothetical protein
MPGTTSAEASGGFCHGSISASVRSPTGTRPGLLPCPCPAMEKQNQNELPNRPGEQAITAMLSGAIASRQCILNGNALVALHLDALIPKPHLHLITVSPDRTDETTVCKFRHLLEEHQLGELDPGDVNLHLQAQRLRITTGTIVDSTILHAPTSTKNREQQRDPEMHQTKKGKQWYFGMKAHVGVDRRRRSSTRQWRRRPTLPIRRCCPIYCTAKKREWGAIRPIAKRAK